jgi:membrane fusion protein, copper/silver efflux system
MRKIALSVVVLVLIIVSFMTGSWYSKRNSAPHHGQGGRKVLYYVDPMHPAYRSDKPGIAPDCGMPLEPVYEGGPEYGTGNDVSKALPGTVRIAPERQQLIGVRVDVAEKASRTHLVRTVGRVVPDETRIYRITTGADGWVKKIFAATTGSLVKKDELLANFSTSEYVGAMKAYLYGLRSLDRVEASATEPKSQAEVTSANIELYRNSLRNLGMSEYQLDEIKRTKTGGDVIEIRAPAAGFILSRNVSLNQRMEKGAEMFKIADMSRVWILADIFENEAQYFRPGVTATVSLPHQQKTLQAKVSDVLPQFDPTSRTFKVRLEADNPGFELRQEMFVDVTLPVVLPPALTVPMDAVLDSGLKKIVFVDRGNGYFEPRKVETGWRFGDRIQIVSGIKPGERVVVSGNFLIDSESRMQMAASGAPGAAATDPSCGHTVDMNKAKNTGRTSEYRGKTYYFCSADCKQKFDSDPERTLAQTAGAPVTAVTGSDGIRHD